MSKSSCAWAQSMLQGAWKECKIWIHRLRIYIVSDSLQRKNWTSQKEIKLVSSSQLLLSFESYGYRRKQKRIKIKSLV
jgi:hypothetical protein